MGAIRWRHIFFTLLSSKKRTLVQLFIERFTGVLIFLISLLLSNLKRFNRKES